MSRPADTSQPDLMTTEEVAAFLRTSPRTVQDWAYRRVGPPSARVGVRRLYARADVMSWLDAQKDIA